VSARDRSPEPEKPWWINFSKIALVAVFFCAAVAVLLAPLLFRRTSLKPVCVRHLQFIQGAKIRWMNENHKTLNDTPTWDDIKEGLSGYAEQYGWKDGIPVCPRGGTYTIGKVGEYPKCSIGGEEHRMSPHAFPPPYHPWRLLA
jgi:hypothetical protein